MCNNVSVVPCVMSFCEYGVSVECGVTRYIFESENTCVSDCLCMCICVFGVCAVQI